MKLKFFFVLLCLPFFSSAQIVHYNISGIIKDAEQAKYAYLIIRGKKAFVTPVIDGKFSFKDTIALGPGFYRGGYLLLDTRGNITVEEVDSKLKQQVWRMGVTPNLRNIALEETQFAIEAGDKLLDATIVKGGELTRQMKELDEFRKERNFKAFVLKYPDSPVSISFISSIPRSFGIPMALEKIEQRVGSPRELFPLLSERLRTSEKGIEVKRIIDEAYKNKQ
jgi:hypothetical protein